MAEFVTSDSHFGHGNIIKYTNRPFLGKLDRQELKRRGGHWHKGNWKSGEGAEPWRMTDEAVDLMNTTLVDEINKRVKRNDILYHGGDYGMAPKSEKHLKDYYKKCREIRDRINCQNIHLVKGNHDRSIIADLFSSFQTRLEFNWNDKYIIIDHYALLTWNRSHRGAWHFYGHSHSEIEAWMNRNLNGRRSMDIGVDNVAKLFGAYRPLSIKDDIAKILGSRRGYSLNPNIPTDADTPEEEDTEN